jgi:hypothetical protein
MPPVRFEPTISAGERPQTHALDRAATGTVWVGTLNTWYGGRQTPYRSCQKHESLSLYDLVSNLRQCYVFRLEQT